MKFSQRIGVVPATKEMQIDGMDSDLRNSLWSIFNELILSRIILDNGRYFSKAQNSLTNHLWFNHFKLPLDNAPTNSYSLNEILRSHFFKAKWHEIYDLIDTCFKHLSVNGFLNNPSNIELAFNNVLEREFSAYRFINGILSRITNDSEIDEIRQSLTQTETFTKLKGCNLHLSTALKMLSDREKPDFRNSIKESISAVESLVNSINGTDSDSLGKALKKIGSNISIHGSLLKGFELLYGYTSDADGIRHFLTSEPNCDFEDAKYMLISCSAFVNYLISKANKAGITFQ